MFDDVLNDIDNNNKTFFWYFQNANYEVYSENYVEITKIIQILIIKHFNFNLDDNKYVATSLLDIACVHGWFNNFNSNECIELIFQKGCIKSNCQKWVKICVDNCKHGCNNLSRIIIYILRRNDYVDFLHFLLHMVEMKMIYFM
jgi:hypothetical protein